MTFAVAMLTRRSGVPKEVDYRLEAWASWALRAADGLGWPHATIIARLIEYGNFGAAAQGAPPVEMPEAVAEIDRIVARMPESLASVLKTHYLTWQPFEAKAQRCDLSVSVYRTRLEAAQWFVYARLMGDD